MAYTIEELRAGIANMSSLLARRRQHFPSHTENTWTRTNCELEILLEAARSTLEPEGARENRLLELEKRDRAHLRNVASLAEATAELMKMQQVLCQMLELPYENLSSIVMHSSLVNEVVELKRLAEQGTALHEATAKLEICIELKREGEDLTLRCSRDGKSYMQLARITDDRPFHLRTKVTATGDYPVRAGAAAAAGKPLALCAVEGCYNFAEPRGDECGLHGPPDNGPLEPDPMFREVGELVEHGPLYPQGAVIHAFEDGKGGGGGIVVNPCDHADELAAAALLAAASPEELQGMVNRVMTKPACVPNLEYVDPPSVPATSADPRHEFQPPPAPSVRDRCDPAYTQADHLCVHCRNTANHPIHDAPATQREHS